MAGKLKFAVYWASMCGGCDVAITHLNEKVLDVVAVADFVFWPCAMDFKLADLQGYKDKSIDVCLFNGGIRTEEHKHIAELLQKKSKVMVAFGSCACFGGITGLANATTRDALFKAAYLQQTSTPNPKKTMPKLKTMVQEGELTLPQVFETALALDQAIAVDYYLPGCPPETGTVAAAVNAIATGKLPPKGATIAGTKPLCDECPKKKEEKKIKEFKRPHEVIIPPDSTKCLLEQGIVCCGPATVSGCGARCISVNMPCRGCYGPPAGVKDQGAKLLSALGSIIDSADEKEIRKIVDQIADPIGTFYRYGLPKALLRRTRAQ
ncbi:MAG: oxidoreductase [Planctomycetota bacterium]|nr:oxidoreductase [Planctomycetota bacterium]